MGRWVVPSELKDRPLKRLGAAVTDAVLAFRDTWKYYGIVVPAIKVTARERQERVREVVLGVAFGKLAETDQHYLNSFLQNLPETGSDFDKTDDLPTDNMLARFWGIVDQLPKEAQAILLMRVCQKCNRMVNVPSVRSWSLANAKYLAMAAKEKTGPYAQQAQVA